MGEAENVVDEEQRVGAFDIAEVFRYGEAGQGNSQPRPRRLGHLTVNQRGFRFFRIARLDHTRLGHFEPKVVAFASSLADAGEYRKPSVLLGDVIDELHDDHGFTHSRATEEPDLPALQEWLDKINDLHSGFEHLGLGGLLLKRRRLAVNRHLFGCRNRA